MKPMGNIVSRVWDPNCRIDPLDFMTVGIISDVKQPGRLWRHKNNIVFHIPRIPNLCSPLNFSGLSKYSRWPRDNPDNHNAGETGDNSATEFASQSENWEREPRQAGEIDHGAGGWWKPGGCDRRKMPQMNY